MRNSDFSVRAYQAAVFTSAMHGLPNLKCTTSRRGISGPGDVKVEMERKSVKEKVGRGI